MRGSRVVTPRPAATHSPCAPSSSPRASRRHGWPVRASAGLRPCTAKRTQPAAVCSPRAVDTQIQYAPSGLILAQSPQTIEQMACQNGLPSLLRHESKPVRCDGTVVVLAGVNAQGIVSGNVTGLTSVITCHCDDDSTLRTCMADRCACFPNSRYYYTISIGCCPLPHSSDCILSLETGEGRQVDTRGVADG